MAGVYSGVPLCVLSIPSSEAGCFLALPIDVHFVPSHRLPRHFDFKIDPLNFKVAIF